jgi:hypothetical protein
MSELTIEARYEKATGHKLPIGYANPDNGYDEDWVALVLEFAQNELNTRPNDAKKMIAEIELLTEALKISCRHQLIVEALSLPECDEMIEQYDDSDDQELMDSYIERAKQSSEGEEG